MKKRLHVISMLIGHPLMLLLLPFLGSLATYVFGYGYLGYFGIPSAFFEFSMKAAIECTIEAMCILVAVDGILAIVGKDDHIDLSLVVWSSLLLLLITETSFTLRFSHDPLRVVFAGAFLFWSVCCRYRKKKFMQPYIMGFASENGFFNRIFGIHMRQIATYVFFCMVLLFIICRSGWYWASCISSFQYITLKKTSYAVIGYYKDHLLLFPIDMKHKKIMKELSVYSIDNLTVGNSPLILSEIDGLHK